MNILIRKDTLNLIAKHESQNALLKFAWLELPHVPVAVCACAQVLDLDAFTDLDVRLLYRNFCLPHCTLDFSTWSRTAILTLLHSAIERMPQLDTVESEVTTQADKIIAPLKIYK